MTKILVTGGSGFLGKAIVAELADPHSPLEADLIRVLDINDYTGAEKDRIEFYKGDIRDISKADEACTGIDIVIHAAAIVDWGTKSEDEILSVNVEGTRNIIRACRTANVKYLVFTSSLDAIFGGKPLVNIDETIPYPEKHPTSYCTSKYLAEKLVLEENDDMLRTCIIRPSDIYGEDDPYHIGNEIGIPKNRFLSSIAAASSTCAKATFLT